MTKTSPRTPEGRVSAVANGGTINGVYCLMPGDALEAFRRDLLELVERPTVDAYMASNRALNWRNAQLRAHGIEPLDLTKVANLTHYPPEGFDFGVKAGACFAAVVRRAYIEGHRHGRANDVITYSAEEDWERSQSKRSLPLGAAA